MKKIAYIFLFLITAGIFLSSCEVYCDEDVTIKRKAIIYLRYNYNNGVTETMNEVQTIRLFLFNLKTGTLYRDTLLQRNEFLTDTGAMQTFISNGKYGIVTMANVGSNSAVATDIMQNSRITFPLTGADPLYFNYFETAVIKGDSLHFKLDLFKSVYKVNVLIDGMDNFSNPSMYYFGLDNYPGLTFGNEPFGDLVTYKPQLTYNSASGSLSGSFYTPYFPTTQPIAIGVYTDDPASVYGHTLFKEVIERYMTTPPLVGKDVEIDIHITFSGSNVIIQISDWEGTITEDIHLGK